VFRRLDRRFSRPRCPVKWRESANREGMRGRCFRAQGLFVGSGRHCMRRAELSATTASEGDSTSTPGPPDRVDGGMVTPDVPLAARSGILACWIFS